MSQALVSLAHAAERGQETLSRICKAFDATAEKLRTTNGTFESGPLQVVFEFQKGKRNVAWKDEATARAKEYADYIETEFDAKLYQQRVLDLTPAGKGSYTAKIQERT